MVRRRSEGREREGRGVRGGKRKRKEGGEKGEEGGEGRGRERRERREGVKERSMVHEYSLSLKVLLEEIKITRVCFVYCF